MEDNEGQLKENKELKKAKEELRESESRFRSLYENSFDSILLTRPDGSILAANPAAEKLFLMSEDEITKAGREGLVVKDDLLERAVKEREQKGKVMSELTFRRKDGSIFIGETASSIFRDVDGSIKTSMIIRDLTERKKTEKLLRDNEEKFSRAFYSNSAGMVIATLEGIIIEVNDAYANLTGFKRDELLNQKAADFNILSTKAREKIIKKLSNGDSVFNEEFEINTKTEEKRSVLFTSEFIEIGGEKRVLTIVYDITERKKTEETLKRERELLQAIIDNIPVMLAIYDPEIDVLRINNETQKVTGWTQEDMNHIDLMKELYPNSDYKREVEEYMQSLTPGWKEITMIARDGSKIDSQWANVNIRGGRNVGIGLDIRERKKTEEEIRNLLKETQELNEELHLARDNLEEQVEERTVELEEAINELKRSNKELQSFAYITSHDLQEPLRTIASYAQLIERRYKGQLDEDADEFLEYMVGGATRMKDMIQGLLDYSRVGTQGGEFTEFNSEEAVKNALSNLHSAIEECHAEVTVNKLPTIIADKDQITRVFQNLIGNALKFQKEGVQPEIHITARKEDRGYVFSVSDNGIGLEEQYTDKIFEVFKRLHAIGEYQGAGIGLAIVKRIIDRHGGRVWVESELGAGSTFYFTIPIGSFETVEEWECRP